VLLTIQDCNGIAVTGATVSSMPAGPVRYVEGIMPSMTATATDVTGVAVIGNLPPGTVTVTTTVDGMMFRPRQLEVVADSFLETEIMP
jgi:hypothetical protein